MMDLTKIMLALGAFALGLCIGGCISIGALVIVVCILFSAYYIVNALMNIADAVIGNLQSLKDAPPEPEEERHMGFQNNLIEINEE